MTVRPVVVVTREEGPDGPLATALEARGARVIALPTTQTLPPPDWGPLDAALAALDSYDWLVFTSARAVSAVWSRPGRPYATARPRVAAVGEATARALAARRRPADLVPERAGGRALASALASREGGLSGARVLWPRSSIARDELRESLLAAGAALDDPVAYRTACASGEGIAGFRRRLAAGEIHAVTFLSPSSARGLAAALGAEDLKAVAAGAAIASIGPTTSDALRALGAAPDVEPAEPDAAALAAALLAHFGRGTATGATG